MDQEVSGRFLLVVGALGLALSVFLAATTFRDPIFSHAHQKEPVLLPPGQIEHFTFGFSDLVADVLWLRSIQDFEFCGGDRKEPGYSLSLQKEITVCKQGWIYQMLDAVTRVAPRFKIAYTRGAIMLSVVVNDLEGANKLFHRAVDVFPDDWYVNYCAAYHFAIEMGDKASAAKYMEVAARTGAPNWVALLAARFYNEAGQAEFGIQALKEFYQDQPFDEWPVRARERYHELEARLKSHDKHK